jgi:hypothetical protein
MFKVRPSNSKERLWQGTYKEYYTRPATVAFGSANHLLMAAFVMMMRFPRQRLVLFMRLGHQSYEFPGAGPFRS